jgi:L-cysteine/cystine lyase
MLWISPAWRDRLGELGATYINLAEPAAGLDGAPQPDARRHDAATQSVEAIATALGAHDVLEHSGWPAVHERAATLAAALADRLADSGRTVAPRDRTTLVSWEDPDPEATRERLAEHGILLRNLPGTPYLRASVGAWNDEADLERLLATL